MVLIGVSRLTAVNREEVLFFSLLSFTHRVPRVPLGYLSVVRTATRIYSACRVTLRSHLTSFIHSGRETAALNLSLSFSLSVVVFDEVTLKGDNRSYDCDKLTG